MTYRIPLSPEDARVLEWESLVGEIKYTGEDLKRHVEARDYADFAVDVKTLRAVLDELERRMTNERNVKTIASLSERHRG